MLRLLLGNLPPGQEASVRTLLSEDDPRAITPTNFQLYQRALEGYALAQRTPDAVVRFSLYRPSEHLALTKEPFLFPTPVPVKVLSFDGHFGYIGGSSHSMRSKDRAKEGPAPVKVLEGAKGLARAPTSPSSECHARTAPRAGSSSSAQTPEECWQPRSIVNECCQGKTDVVDAALSLKKGRTWTPSSMTMCATSSSMWPGART